MEAIHGKMRLTSAMLVSIRAEEHRPTRPAPFGANGRGRTRLSKGALPSLYTVMVIRLSVREIPWAPNPPIHLVP